MLPAASQRDRPRLIRRRRSRESHRGQLAVAGIRPSQSARWAAPPGRPSRRVLPKRTRTRDRRRRTKGCDREAPPASGDAVAPDPEEQAVSAGEVPFAPGDFAAVGRARLEGTEAKSETGPDGLTRAAAGLERGSLDRVSRSAPGREASRAFELSNSGCPGELLMAPATRPAAGASSCCWWAYDDPGTDRDGTRHPGRRPDPGHAGPGRGPLQPARLFEQRATVLEQAQPRPGRQATAGPKPQAGAGGAPSPIVQRPAAPPGRS